MKILFVRRPLIIGILIFSFLMDGCTGTSQPSSTSVVIPTLMPSLAPTDPPFTPSPTTSVSESTPTSTASIPQSSVLSVKDNASFVSETYPDYSILKPGESFIKSFEIKNIGTTTWAASYALVLDQTQSSDALSSPSQINLDQETPPDGKITFKIPLVAPTVPGTYTTYWSLKNDCGETIPVDGGKNVWAKILVCDPNQPCSPPASGGSGTTTSGVSATLTNFTSNAQSATASFCMTLPNRNYGPTPGSVSLVLDQQNILTSTGGSLDTSCFEFEFPVTATQVQQAKNVAVSITQVRILGGPNDPNGNCQAVRPNLMAQYPGLDFQCNFSMSGYYSNLQLPAGMTSEQAREIIFDAIEGAVNGPWILTVR